MRRAACPRFEPEAGASPNPPRIGPALGLRTSRQGLAGDRRQPRARLHLRAVPRLTRTCSWAHGARADQPGQVLWPPFPDPCFPFALVGGRHSAIADKSATIESKPTPTENRLALRRERAAAPLRHRTMARRSAGGARARLVRTRRELCAGEDRDRFQAALTRLRKYGDRAAAAEGARLGLPRACDQQRAVQQSPGHRAL